MNGTLNPNEKNQKNKDWKSKLISSSIPLEFEAARILVSEKFWITADYTYSRDDSGTEKDFSVDLWAQIYTPYSDPNEITASLELLIECKQRHPKINWLFLPDINRGDFSPVIIGITLRVLDNFCYKFVPSTTAFDCDGPFCYKGIEIDENSGRVDDSELRHGISQLQYALPRLISRNIISSTWSSDDDCIPYLFCPILLTTSKLYILNRNAHITDIEKATSINDIAQCVPYLILYSDCGPDFEKHCIRECDLLKNIPEKSFSEITQYRQTHGEYDYRLPMNITSSLAEGRESKYFTQFVVCSLDNFPTLLRKIKKVTADVIKKRKRKK